MISAFFDKFRRSKTEHPSNFLTETRQEIDTIINIAREISCEMPDNFWEARAFSDQIIDFLPVMVLVKDIASKKYVRVNKTAQQYFGIEESNFVGKSAADILTSEAATEDEKADQECIMSNEASYNVEVSFDVRGVKMWFKTNRALVKDYSGKNKYIVVIYDNITANKMIADELFDAKNFIEKLLKSLPIPVFWKDTNYRYLGCNQAYSSILGLKPEALAGKDVWEIFPKERADEVAERDNKVLKQGQSDSYMDKLYSIEHHGIRNVRFRKNPIYNNTGDIIGLIGVALDETETTESKKINDILLEALENSHDAILLTNEYNRIIYVNREYENMHGYARHELLGHKPSILSSGLHDGNYFREMWEKIKVGKTWLNKIIDKRKDGTMVEGYQTIIPIMNDKPNPIYYLAIKHKMPQD